MGPFKKLGFLSIYLMILLSNGVFIFTHGQFTWTGVLFAYGLVPLVDALMGKDKNNAGKEDFERLMNDRFFDGVVYSLVYVHLMQLGWAVFAILTYKMTLFQWTGYVLSLGIFAGTMINVAPELGHHAYASRSYQVLRHFDGCPQLPFGYPLMILMSMLPPLWFLVMNKRLERWQCYAYDSQHIAQVVREMA